MNKYNIFIKL